MRVERHEHIRQAIEAAKRLRGEWTFDPTRLQPAAVIYANGERPQERSYTVVMPDDMTDDTRPDESATLWGYYDGRVRLAEEVAGEVERDREMER